MQNATARPQHDTITNQTNRNDTSTSRRLPLANALCVVVLAAGLLIGIVPGAQSQLVFTDRTAFNAAIASAGLTTATEGYESYPNDLQPGPRILTLGSFSVSYDVSDAVSSFGITDGPIPGGSGIGPTAGSKFLYAAYPTAAAPSGTVSFLLNTPTYVFGTDIKDLENPALTYSTSSGANGVAAFPGADGNVQFFGIISNTAFTSIGFTGTGITTGDGVVFDQTTISTSTPEPSAALFGVIGILGIASYRFRLKRRLRS